MKELNNYLIYGGVNSADYQIKITGEGTYKAPSPEFEKYSVPGRNGDLIRKSARKKYPNVEVTYQCLAMHDVDVNLRAWRDRMMASTGYQKIEDTFHPDEYRLGIVSQAIEPEMGINLESGIFPLVFDCMPQRWLKDGQNAITITASGTKICNPTSQNALPLIYVYGSGTVDIGGVRFTIASYSGSYIIIDCDTMQCYRGLTNMGQYVTLSETDYPVIEPGEHAITFSGPTRVDIIPRWWRL